MTETQDGMMCEEGCFSNFFVTLGDINNESFTHFIMKKLFALVTGLLFATGFDVLADSYDSPLKNLEKTDKMTNGGEYFLTMYNGGTNVKDGVLTVQGDSLAMVDYEVFDNYSRSRQDSNLWVVNWTNEAVYGNFVYTFTNKSTGKNLSLPKEEGKALVDAPNGFSQYLWIGHPTGTGSSRKYTKGDIPTGYICADTSLWVCKTFTLTKDITAEAGKLSYNTLKSLSGEDAVGYESIRLVKWANSAPSINVDIQDTQSATDEEIAEYKRVVALWDSLLATYGMSRETAGLESYKRVADAVDGLSSENRDVSGFYHGDRIYAIDELEKVIEYGEWGSCGKDYATGVWRGTLFNIPDRGFLRAGEKYAAGTVLIAGYEWVMAAQYKREEIADGGRYFGEGSIDKPENDPTYIEKFTNLFREGEQPDSSVVLTLDFSQGDAPTATNNILEGKKIQLVKKNLLLDGDLVSCLTHPNALSDFRWAQMIYDPEADKYLYVSDDTYDETSQSTNFVLKWVSLKDLSGCLTGTGENAPKAGVSYNNICDEEGNALPHAGSAIFRILYNRTDSSIAIFPYKLYLKQSEASAADTTGSSAYYDYKENPYSLNNSELPEFVLGLKKLGSDVVLTVVNTTTDKLYPIHKGIAQGNYTKAETESDLYFIRHVSHEDAENNGKYYTAGGLKAHLTEFELKNMPENQWVLLTDEGSGLSSIHNRGTNLVFTDLRGKKYENVQLYDGTGLKAEDIIVTTIGGDTLRLTTSLAADSLRNKSTLGYFVPSAYNEVMEYEFNYYNGLDDTKKLGVDNDSLLFVDPTGGSAKFKLIVGNLSEYGAPGIPGKTATLHRYSYNLATTVNGDTCVVVEKGGKYAVAKKGSTAAVDFFFKEMAENGYALVEANRSCKASVSDESLRLTKEPLTEVRTSLFSMQWNRFDVYRRFGKTIEDCITWNDTAYVRIFKANEPSRYLYENSMNEVAGILPDGLGYLGMYNRNDKERNASIFVDPVCVTDSAIMFTYMLAVDVTAGADTLSGRYLVSLSDSTSRPAATYNGYTRLAFVDAKHVGGSLIVSGMNDTIALTKDLNKATFALELTDRIENNASADFYIKSSDGYVWVNNGVPVLTSDKEKAAVFNAMKTEVVPTANENILVEGLKVMAGEGFVAIKGAEGKKVTIANVLGQTIASEIASSDEVRIAAPAGVVLVKVEGEKAVKAIVK